MKDLLIKLKQKRHDLEEVIYQRYDEDWMPGLPMNKNVLNALLDVDQDSVEVASLSFDDFNNHSWDVGSWYMLKEIIEEIEEICKNK